MTALRADRVARNRAAYGYFREQRLLSGDSRPVSLG